MGTGAESQPRVLALKPLPPEQGIKGQRPLPSGASGKCGCTHKDLSDCFFSFLCKTRVGYLSSWSPGAFNFVFLL